MRAQPCNSTGNITSGGSTLRHRATDSRRNSQAGCERFPILSTADAPRSQSWIHALHPQSSDGIGDRAIQSCTSHLYIVFRNRCPLDASSVCVRATLWRRPFLIDGHFYDGGAGDSPTGAGYSNGVVSFGSTAG